jgi:predicted nucleotidyltransferase component of viral defense system
MDKKISSPNQLKDLIGNMSKKNHIAAGTILQNYMMERLLERVSLSEYRDNLILKGGFLISAMIGIDLRSTMDIDTTIKGIAVSEANMRKIMEEIIRIPVDDHVAFEIVSISPIHEEGAYEDFRISLLATFFTIKVHLKVDVTTGDAIIPRETEYQYRLMFEDRSIDVKAYNVYTILAEKLESVLARNVTNTRARDFYDIYILMKTKEIDRKKLWDAVVLKARERGSGIYLEKKDKYLKDIKESADLKQIWDAYQKKYPYAAGISYGDILEQIGNALDNAGS